MPGAGMERRGTRPAEPAAERNAARDAITDTVAPRPELRHRKPPNFREFNKPHYRLAHWPIWIFVFFIAPGPLTFDLFERGFDARMAAWLAVVLAGTGLAGWFGQ